MAILGLIMDFSPSLKDYINKTIERIDNSPLFRGMIKRYPAGSGKDLYVIILKPLLPGVYYVGMLWVLPILVFGGSFWLMLPGLIFFSFGFFWTKYFFYIILYIALRKNRYKGKIKIVPNSYIIKHILGFSD